MAQRLTFGIYPGGAAGSDTGLVSGPPLVQAVTGMLETMRNVWLPSAGIPMTVPIHVTEHGWPTGPHRSEGRQSEVVEKVVRAEPWCLACTSRRGCRVR